MKCPICGSEFEPKRCSQKYCSRKCQVKFNNAQAAEKRKAAQAENPKPKPKCAHCGAEFEPKRRSQKYCSKKCCDRVSLLKKRDLPQTKKCAQSGAESKKCPICGSEFEPKRRSQKYCSRECQIKNNNAQAAEKRKAAQAEKPKPKPKCLICGQEFEPTRSQQKYCPNCQVKGGQIKCVHCGKLFTPVFKGTSFCSRLCYRLYIEKKKAAAKEILDAVSHGQGGCLNDLAKLAAECNLDYGTYRGLIAAGKTHDELKAQAPLRNLPNHNHSYLKNRKCRDID